MHVETVIIQRLGRSIAPGEIEVDGRIRYDHSAGYRITLRTRMHGVDDERELQAHDCRTLVDATALLVAVTLDAVRVAEHVADLVSPNRREPPPIPQAGQDSGGLEQPAVPSRETTPEPSVARERTPTRVAPWVSIAGAGGVVVGALPAASGGPHLAVAVAWPRVRLELGGSWLAPRTATTAEGQVRVQLGTVTPRACIRLGMPRLEAPLCAGLELGAMRGDGREAPGARTAHGMWVAPVVGTGFHGWMTEVLALFVRLDLAVPVAHPRFQLSGPGDPVELHRAAPVTGRLWVGLEGRLARTPRDRP
jgi:hypothetical protein